MKKRTVLFFVYDGFTDCDISYALTGIGMSDIYRVKTIAHTREPIQSGSGLTVLPDLDFFPETDLSDIDNSTVAMLILPGGYSSEQHTPVIQLLIMHCLQNDIPVVSMCNTTLSIHDIVCVNNDDVRINDQLSYLNIPANNYQYTDGYKNAWGAYHENSVTMKGFTSLTFANAVFELLNIRNNFKVAAWFNELVAAEIG